MERRRVHCGPVALVCERLGVDLLSPRREEGDELGEFRLHESMCRTCDQCRYHTRAFPVNGSIPAVTPKPPLPQQSDGVIMIIIRMTSRERGTSSVA